MKKVFKGILVVFAGLFTVVALAVASVVGSILVVLVAVILSADDIPDPPGSIGDCKCVAYCSDYVFQDGMSYREYRYTHVSFEDNSLFQAVTKDNMLKVQAYVKDYEDWVELEKDSTRPEAQELYHNYRYDIATLSETDYFYLETGDFAHPFEDYDIYIFDTEGMTLYHLESNT